MYTWPKMHNELSNTQDLNGRILKHGIILIQYRGSLSKRDKMRNKRRVVFIFVTGLAWFWMSQETGQNQQPQESEYDLRVGDSSRSSRGPIFKIQSPVEDLPYSVTCSWVYKSMVSNSNRLMILKLVAN